jgi:hypothetical protein
LCHQNRQTPLDFLAISRAICTVEKPGRTGARAKEQNGRRRSLNIFKQGFHPGFIKLDRRCEDEIDAEYIRNYFLFVVLSE